MHVLIVVCIVVSLIGSIPLLFISYSEPYYANIYMTFFAIMLGLPGFISEIVKSLPRKFVSSGTETMQNNRFFAKFLPIIGITMLCLIGPAAAMLGISIIFRYVPQIAIACPVNHLDFLSLPVTTQIKVQSLLRGMYAGLVGGCVASVLEVAAYFMEARNYLKSIEDDVWSYPARTIFFALAPILTFVIFAGTVLGLCLELGWILTDSYLDVNYLLKFLIGGLLGGIITGVILGPIGGWHFGRKYLPVANPITSSLAAVPGLAVAVFILSICHHGSSSGVAQLSAITAPILCLIVAYFFKIIGESTRVDQKVMSIFFSWNEWGLIYGGVIFGIICGLIFGIAISTSLLLITYTLSP